ncbi:hypothetical protein FD754_022589 [Muntiacus muntjak]|uniref:Uncharacterized protein n=1 Tax=Muntiacus muntjak TaxID=9888 RepID=A0A5N3V969_MUNMU|nr:hypothetical protein FD754_022589 [Muntiacus muntjak]
MSSRDDEVSVGGAGFGLQGGELGPEPGVPQSSEGGFPDPEGFESEREVLDAGGLVLWGREGRPGSPVDDKGDALQLTDESVAAILRQLSDLDMLAISRYPYLESYVVGEVFILWADLEAGPGGRGAAAQSSGEVAPVAAGRAWGNPKRGTKSRPSSTAPRIPGTHSRHSNVQGRENLLNVLGTLLSSTLRGFTSVVERQGKQGNREPDISSPKKMQSMLWGKGGNGPSYPGRYTLVPLGTKESKHMGAGKKSMVRRVGQVVSMLAMAGEDDNPGRNPFPKAQPSCPWMHHGEPSSGDLNIRGLQDPGNSEPMALNRAEVMPRGPDPPGDQEPTDHSPRVERQQQPPGTQGCLQCLVLQRETDDLKEQRASMQHLADEFQIL